MILQWDIFEISHESATLHGVMLRGRVRKFSIENNITCLVENASDKENVVRFAILTDSSSEEISNFVNTLLPNIHVEKILKSVENPILSKLKVNDTSRY